MGIVRARPQQPTPPAADAPRVKSRRGPALLLALGIPALVAVAGEAAIAETKKTSPATAPRVPHGLARPAAQKGGAGPSADAGAASPTVSVSANTASSAADGGFVETKGSDGGMHVFKFSELDIEGRLKSPQLVYFLRRVRAEFAAGDLGHRTFMREMSETRKESSF